MAFPAFGTNNAYEVLGVNKDVSGTELKSAYRELVKIYHPDANLDANPNDKKVFEDKYKDVVKAYDILKDPKTRAEYDRNQGFTSNTQNESYSNSSKNNFPVFKDGKNAYEVLGVDNDANEKTIQSAYRELEKIYHPDVNQDPVSEEKFRDIVQAYEILKDPETRAAYDRYVFIQNESYSRGIFKDIFNDSQKENSAMEVELKPYERRAIEIFSEFSFFQKDIDKFLETETKHLELLKKQQRGQPLSSSEKKELYDYRFENLKDLEVFKRVLNHLGLPYGVLHPVFLQTYLDDLRWEWYYKNYKNFKKTDKNTLAFSKEIEKTTLYLPGLGTDKNTLALPDLRQEGYNNNFKKTDKNTLALDDLRQEWYNNNFKKTDQNSSTQGRTEFQSNKTDQNSLTQGRTEFQSNKTDQNSLTQGRTEFQSNKAFFVINELKEVIKEIKSSIDNSHSESLKEGAQISKRTFLKNFGTQFIVFHTALGFSIYMHALFDKKITGYEKNPGELLEAVQQSLTPSGIASFLVFVAVSSKVQHRMYGLGRFLDGKTVLGKSWNGGLARSLSPSLGLGTGFFFHNIFYELLNDPDLASCVKGQFNKKDESEQNLSKKEKYISHCEQFYMNWKAGEKWRIYGVDIASLIGSSIISHKIISSISWHLSRTMIGDRVMALVMKKLGPRVIGGGNLLIQMFLFLEVHKVLEKWAGRPLKKQLLAQGVSERVSNFSTMIKVVDDFIKPEFWAQTSTESVKNETQFVVLGRRGHFKAPLSTEPINPYRLYSNRFNKNKNLSPLFFKGMINSIKSLGNSFRIWTELVNQDYIASYHRWIQKINRRFINYTNSFELLDKLFYLSQNDDNNFPHKFQRDILDEERENYIKYCSKVNSLEADKLELWRGFCQGGENKDAFYHEPEKMIYETSYIISNFLSKVTLPNFKVKVEDYISLEKDKVFLSKPDFSIQKLMTKNYGINGRGYNKRFILAKQLIKKGLDLKTLLDGFSSTQIYELKKQKFIETFRNNDKINYFMYPNRFSKEIDTYCGDSFKNEKKVKYCKEFFKTSGRAEIKTELSLKFLTAGIYILQNFLKKSRFRLSYRDRYGRIMQSSFFHIEDLIGLIETHKKGEKIFLEHVEVRESAKTFFSKAVDVIDQIPGINQLGGQDGSLYFIFYNLICGSSTKRADSFSNSQLLSTFNNIKLYNFDESEYQPLEDFCKKTSSGSEEAIHEFLFDNPAKYDGISYENLYLSVEHIIGSNYENREDMLKNYFSSSLEQLNTLKEPILLEKQLLMDQFYKNIINQDFEILYNNDEDFKGINQDLLNYYDENKVDFNFCSLFDKLSFGFGEKLTGGCEEGLKNIELSIFQVNILLKNLKTLLLKGNNIKQVCEKENCNLNESFLFNKRGVCKNESCDDLKEQFFFLKNKEKNIEYDETQLEIMRSKVITRLQRIQDCYKEGKEEEKECLDLKKDLFDGHLNKYIQSFVPKSLTDISLEYNSAEMESHWNKIVYSILFELNKSLNNFKGQLMPLTLNINFELRRDPSLE